MINTRETHERDTRETREKHGKLVWEPLQKHEKRAFHEVLKDSFLFLDVMGWKSF